MQDYSDVSEIFMVQNRHCFTIMTTDNNTTEPNKNFSLNLMPAPFGISRSFNSNLSSISIEIINDDVIGELFS